MGDAELEAALEKALTSYFTAFCSQPAKAAFNVSAGSGNVMGHLTCATSDWNTFVQDQELQEHFNSTLETLSTWLDSSRTSGGVDFIKA